MKRQPGIAYPQTRSLVDVFDFDVQERRRDRNFEAAKSLTRFTVLLMLLFMACWFQLWIQ